jgi:phycocyanin beta chain
MNTNVTAALQKANAQGRYLSGSELEYINQWLSSAENRVDIVQKINNNASTIVAQAARSVFYEQPHLIAPGGNAYGSRRMAACLNDMQIFLRYITYAMIAGDSSVLDDRLLCGLKETYAALGTPTASVAISIHKMKDITLKLAKESNASEELMHEFSSYFDKVAVSIA